MNDDKEIIKLYVERYIKIIGLNKDQQLRNMCLNILNNIDDFPLHKMYRWIGFIQKSVIDMKLTTLAKENKFTNDVIDVLPNKIIENYSFEEHF